MYRGQTEPSPPYVLLNFFFSPFSLSISSPRTPLYVSVHVYLLICVKRAQVVCVICILGVSSPSVRDGMRFARGGGGASFPG